MKTLSKPEFEIIEAPDVPANFGFARSLTKALPKLKWLFKDPAAPDHLSARLRRDAGINDVDAEYKRFAKAPLIR